MREVVAAGQITISEVYDGEKGDPGDLNLIKNGTFEDDEINSNPQGYVCLLYTSPSPRD